MTTDLIRAEQKKFGIDAELKIVDNLPSFEIANFNGRIVISAPNQLEQLYGIYDFAEKFRGWCFFEPGRDRFDQTLIVNDLPEGILVPAVKPFLKRRGLIQEFPFDAETPDLFDWMAKNKLNYLLVWMKYYDCLSEELKQMATNRGIVIESGHHNFNYWIPGKVYGKTHPEYFAEAGGKRINPTTSDNTLLLSEQLCTTNPELRREIIENMIEYCARHPEIKVISLIPNDGFGWCECENCSRFYDKNERGELYSVSSHVYKADRIYHDLLREVAAGLRAVRPDIMISFCAYINYCAPSKGFVLEKGMMVHFAPYWRCINHPVYDEGCPINSHYKDDILAWSRAKRGGEVNIYEYYMGVNFYLSLPMVHHREMFAEMKWYHDNQIDGVLTQFHIGHWSAYGTNYYLMGKAARGESEKAAIDFMFNRVFGDKAGKIRNFYQKLKNLTLRAGHCHIPYPYSILSRTKLDDYQEILRLARDIDEKDFILWAKYMLKFKSLFDRYHSGKLEVAELRQFLEWIHSNKNHRVYLPAKFNSYLGAWIKAIESGKPYLHFNIEWEDDYIRQHKTLLGKPETTP